MRALAPCGAALMDRWMPERGGGEVTRELGRRERGETGPLATDCQDGAGDAG